MIKVTVMYPDTEGSTFDWEYYLERHIPLVCQRLASALKGAAVDRGLAGDDPGSRPPFIALVHLLFDSVEEFLEAFEPHEKEIMGDILNYTNIRPTTQISEVVNITSDLAE